MHVIPRPEHPRPQFEREAWMNLNGAWQFEIDQGRSGRARGLSAGRDLESRITVPFCPESELSGIGHKDFMAAVCACRSSGRAKAAARSSISTPATTRPRSG